MQIKHSFQLFTTKVIFALIASFLFAMTASAHVKWFSAYDVAEQPRSLGNVLRLDFILLSGLAVLLLLCGYVIERSGLGAALLQALDRATEMLRSNPDLLIRAVCGFFFVAIWTKAGVILTPELKTNWQLVSWLQLCIAVGLIWRRTLPVSALGIMALYAIGMHEYGIFHMLDYPIFLGIAVYLALVGLQRDLFGVRPLDILRWSAAITLMWASIEKWAYPQWTFPLFITHPALTMGYSSEFFMRAAGVVEFTLSFALFLTPLVRRFAALILGVMFIIAIPIFGKIDAIGHAPIIAVLLAIIADNLAGYQFRPAHAVVKSAGERPHEMLSKWHWVHFPIGYFASLAGFLTVYYVLHAELFGTRLI